MRQLINAPMLHSPEMIRSSRGDLGQFFTNISVSASEMRSEEFWQIVGERLSQLKLVSPRFYLEGYVGPQTIIVPDASETPLLRIDGPEDLLIDKFMRRVGGTLEQTEKKADLDQVFQAYRQTGEAATRIREFMQFHTGEGNAEIGALMRKMIETHALIGRLQSKRDSHIAKVIKDTLKEGETGVFFMGGDHDATRMLPRDIKVELLDERLPEIIRESSGEEILPPLEFVRHGPEGKV